METDGVLHNVLNAIIRSATKLLVEELWIEASVEGAYQSVDKVTLRKYTTMVGIGGALNLLFYTTYDDLLLDQITAKFVYGAYQEDEFAELRESAAGEIANIFIGQALNDFPNGGSGVNITPPVTIEDAKSIFKSSGSQILSAILLTPYGKMEFNVIGSTGERTPSHR